MKLKTQNSKLKSMVPRHNEADCKFYFTVLVMAAVLFFFEAPSVLAREPYLANYFLNTLPADEASVLKLSKNDVLILSASEITARRAVIDRIKRLHPDIIILAYFPAQSYNTTHWKNDLVFKNLQVKNDWWLKDVSGRVISPWSGIYFINMHPDWSAYYAGYINDYLRGNTAVDGVFLDMVSENVSWAGKNIDINNDGIAESAADLDKLWLDRMRYFLEYAGDNLRTKYIIMNGSSKDALQPFVNGRMFETFPTKWESDGRWGTLMNNLLRIKTKNRVPQLYIFNSNTKNTGAADDYREMRFGLASSLLENDVYFSFDYGEANHGQIWSYDEYQVDLGAPFGSSRSISGGAVYNDADVWRRDYVNGLVLVNPTVSPRSVVLNGDYEKITGTQDKEVNDGRIVSEVTVGPRDGLLLLKTFQNIKNVLFSNGYFLHFINTAGERVRNGFFAYDEGSAGGTKIYYGDLNGDRKEEKIAVNGPRLEIYNDRGEWWFEGYPLGANFKGEVFLAIGSLADSLKDNIVVCGSNTGEAILLTYYGQVLKNSFYPLGKTYKKGLMAAVGDVNGDKKGEIIFGTGPGSASRVLIYDSEMKKKIKEFYPYGLSHTGGISLASGDVNGDGRAEIITASSIGKKTAVRIFDVQGKKISGFEFGSVFGGKNIVVGVSDVDFNGAADIVIMSR